MSEKIVVGLYLAGALAMIAGVAIVICRLVGFWIEAPAEIMMVGGFVAVLGAKLMARSMAKGNANG